MQPLRKYAEGTKVPVEKSKADLEGLLRKSGATSIAMGWDQTLGARVLFRLEERFVQILIPVPDPKVYRTPAQREAEERRLWRSRLLIVKAKLEVVLSGETTVSREFLADLLLPDGSTVGDVTAPVIAEAYETGDMPRSLLPGLGPSLPALTSGSRPSSSGPRSRVRKPDVIEGEEVP